MIGSCLRSALTVMALAVPMALSGQTVKATIFTFATTERMAGVTVLLVDSNGNVRAASVSDSAGAVTLTAPFAGVFTVRVQRIGWRLVLEPNVALDATTVLELDLLVRESEVALDPITITAEGSAAPIPPRLF